MDIKTQEMYSEVYSILNLLGESYIKKLPDNLFNMIKEKREKDYNPQYNKEINLEQQNINREALAMIALFHLNYWCNSNQEKSELKILLKNNEEKHQAEIREKYNPDNIFKKQKADKRKVENIIENEVSMVKYKETIFKKLINKIKDFLNKK